jgi:DNA-binding NarL/FixJ family response regulator
MTRLGMRRVLAESGIDVVDEDDAAGVVVHVGRLLPDAVVLGFDGEHSLELSERVRSVAPDAKVILWTHDESAIEVFDPGSSAPRLIQRDVPEALLGELSAGRSTPRGE